MKWKHRLRELDLQSVALKSLLVRETNEMETHKRGRRQIRALVILIVVGCGGIYAE